MFFASPTLMTSIAGRFMRMFVRQTEANMKWSNRVGVCYTMWTVSALSGFRQIYQNCTPRF